MSFTEHHQRRRHGTRGAQRLLIDPIRKADAELGAIAEMLANRLRPVAKQKVNLGDFKTAAKTDQTFEEWNSGQRRHRLGNIADDGAQSLAQSSRKNGALHCVECSVAWIATPTACSEL